MSHLFENHSEGYPGKSLRVSSKEKFLFSKSHKSNDNQASSEEGKHSPNSTIQNNSLPNSSSIYRNSLHNKSQNLLKNTVSMNNGSIRKEGNVSVYFRGHFSVLGFSITSYFVIVFLSYHIPLLQWFYQFKLFRFFKSTLLLLGISEFILILLKIQIIKWRNNQNKEEDALIEKSLRASKEDIENAKLLGLSIEQYLEQKHSLGHPLEAYNNCVWTQNHKISSSNSNYCTVSSNVNHVDLDDIFLGEVIKLGADDKDLGQRGFPFSISTQPQQHNFIIKPNVPATTTTIDQKKLPLSNIQPFFRKKLRNIFSQSKWDNHVISENEELNEYLQQYESSMIQPLVSSSQNLQSTGIYSPNRLGGAYSSAASQATIFQPSMSTSYPSSYQTSRPDSLFSRQGYRGIQAKDMDLINDINSLNDSEYIPNFQEIYKEAQFSLKYLNIDSRQLVTWSDNLRSWTVENILKNLIISIEENSKQLKDLGFVSYDCIYPLDEVPHPDTRIPDHLSPPIDGRLTLRYIVASLSQSNVVFKNRLMLEYYLDIPSSSRKYVIKRIKELSSSSFMESYKWSSGASFEGQKWDPRMQLPNDSQIIIHVFRKWMDLIFPSDSLYGQNSFSMKHFLDQSMIYGKKSSLDSNLYIVMESAQPPLFSIVHNKKTIRVEPGRNNLFYALCIFIYIVKIHYKGTLDHTWLGSQNFNVLKVVSD